MKALTPEFYEHLQGTPTTYAMCWKVTPKPPGLAVGFTEHVNNIVVDGFLYSARSGFSPSALRTTHDLAVDNFDVTFLLEFDGTAEAQLLAGYYDYAKVVVFLVNYDNPGMGSVILASGTLGEVMLFRGQARAEIRGLSQALQSAVLELTSPTCRAQLGDNRCQVNLANITNTGSVTGSSQQKYLTDNMRFEGDGHFNGGLLTFLSGENALLHMEVKHYYAKQFELYHAMPYPIAIGDTYRVYRGCNKSLSVCRDVFNNIINFRGEPHLPGLDHMLQFGGR